MAFFLAKWDKVLQIDSVRHESPVAKAYAHGANDFSASEGRCQSTSRAEAVAFTSDLLCHLVGTSSTGSGLSRCHNDIASLNSDELIMPELLCIRKLPRSSL